MIENCRADVPVIARCAAQCPRPRALADTLTAELQHCGSERPAVDSPRFTADQRQRCRGVEVSTARAATCSAWRRPAGCNSGLRRAIVTRTVNADGRRRSGAVFELAGSSAVFPVCWSTYGVGVVEHGKQTACAAISRAWSLFGHVFTAHTPTRTCRSRICSVICLDRPAVQCLTGRSASQVSTTAIVITLAHRRELARENEHRRAPGDAARRGKWPRCLPWRTGPAIHRPEHQFSEVGFPEDHRYRRRMPRIVRLREAEHLRRRNAMRVLGIAAAAAHCAVRARSRICPVDSPTVSPTWRTVHGIGQAASRR